MATSGYLGADSFAYQASNGYADSAPTTVSLTVGPGTLTWAASSGGNWTDSQWSSSQKTGTGSTCPDATTNAVVDSAVVVQVTATQTADALAIAGGGQVAVGPGAVLSVTTSTSVTGGAALNVDPNGLLAVGGTLTLDTGGSVTGGPIYAAGYQLNSGMASANLGGLGGVTKATSGTVTLSGTNTYAGPTVVKAGTLIVTSSSRLARRDELDRRGGRGLSIRSQSGGGSADRGSRRVRPFGRCARRYGGARNFHVDRCGQRGPTQRWPRPPFRPCRR